jgi:hypothetical protein
MAVHTVVIPRDITLAFDEIYTQTCIEDRDAIGVVIERLICKALKKSDDVKRKLRRDHMAAQMVRGEPHTIGMSAATWAAVDEHAERYGLPSRSEAFRELLRLGLNIPPPKVSPDDLLRTRRSSPAKQQHWQKVRALCKSGMSQVEIAKIYNVSRQNIHAIVKRGEAP